MSARISGLACPPACVSLSLHGTRHGYYCAHEFAACMRRLPFCASPSQSACVPSLWCSHALSGARSSDGLGCTAVLRCETVGLSPPLWHVSTPTRRKSERFCAFTASFTPPPFSAAEMGQRCIGTVQCLLMHLASWMHWDRCVACVYVLEVLERTLSDSRCCTSRRGHCRGIDRWPMSLPPSPGPECLGHNWESARASRTRPSLQAGARNPRDAAGALPLN